uniref:WD_REPEATS_REGION domain-containing protein n=1 Tax=Rhabditophanes sp. KR3021 TaxID=114890 RepID=A0AC35TGU9_9BILA
MNSDGFKTPTKLPRNDCVTPVMSPRRLFDNNQTVAYSPNSKLTMANGKTLTTPTKFRPDGGDRYIPNRREGDEWSVTYSACNRNILYDFEKIEDKEDKEMDDKEILEPKLKVNKVIPRNCVPSMFADNRGSENRNTCKAYLTVLRNEMLNDCIEVVNNDENTDINALNKPKYQSLFKYGKHDAAYDSHIGSTCPWTKATYDLLNSPTKNSPRRKIPKSPYKVLDAPDLADDFYLNLVDWSSTNILSVGLGATVYLWSATNSQVTKLCEMPSDESIASVQWSEDGSTLAVGICSGVVHIYDAETHVKVREFREHEGRVGVLNWNGNLLCSGSRDRNIICRDIRQSTPVVTKLSTHKQEVCGLKWSPDKVHLASGGNDNQLLIWDIRRTEPVQIHKAHIAAVKALAWSPHTHGLLVSGGGTADKTLRFVNTLTGGQAMHAIDTGSQVCNLAWSKISDQIVSTHGYSKNEIMIWKYPFHQKQPIAKLTGHQNRVLYLAMSPDGENIVTGAGGSDDTLKFFKIDNKPPHSKQVRSNLNLYRTAR